MEIRSYNQRHRAPPRGVSSADQDTDLAAVPRDHPDAVLSLARRGPDPNAKGRWMGNPPIANEILDFAA